VRTGSLAHLRRGAAQIMGRRRHRTSRLGPEALARLRLFAQARECAGAGETEIEGRSVGEVLDAAGERYGARFAAVVAISAIWLNGDPANRESPVGDHDEVAVLPPVSGG